MKNLKNQKIIIFLNMISFQDKFYNYYKIRMKKTILRTKY
jgi:hypothetical protein